MTGTAMSRGIKEEARSEKSNPFENVPRDGDEMGGRIDPADQLAETFQETTPGSLCRKTARPE